MGQIQNAVLNTLGSVQQMVQLYKLTDTYIEGQRKKSADAAKAAAEEQAQAKYEDLKKEYEKTQTVEQVKAKIHAEPYSGEENAKYKEFYNRFYDNTYKDNDARKKALGKEKRQLTNLITNYQGDINSPEYREWVRRRQWLDDTKDFKYLYESEDKDNKAKAQKSPQEQANTNDNIKKAKKAAKGGKK